MMKDLTTRFEYEALVERLNYFRDRYYNDNISEISDEDYDAFFDLCKKYEEEHNYVAPNSPTISVGYEVKSKLTKVKHDHPLLSLQKTTNVEDIVKFAGDKAIIAMLKMDGLTATLRYKNGVLVKAETRGNGEIGEDILHNVKTFVGLPLTIPFRGTTIIDGECIIKYNDFNAINAGEGADFKHPRNLASGSVRQLDSRICAKRKVHFVAWKVQMIDGEKDDYLDDGLSALDMCGFETVTRFTFINGSAEFIQNTVINVLREKAAKYDYPIDGIVFAYHDVKYGESLGATGHHPRHSLAFKFYQERTQTILRNIVWETSRTGRINPTCYFDPVEIDGTTVSYATSNNVSFIEDMKLSIGDTIEVIKANQIIPQVVGNVTQKGGYEIPKVCPCCGAPAVIQQKYSSKMLYCTNADCPAIHIDKMVLFCSQNGMNIMGLSEKRLEALMSQGFIKTFGDIFRLKNYKEEIEKLPGFGADSVNSLLDSIENSRTVRLQNVLAAIGIPLVGVSGAKQLAKFLAENGDKDRFGAFILLALANYDWSQINDIGNTTRMSINDFVENNADELFDLASEISVTVGKPDVSEKTLKGMTVCVTGSLEIYPNRKALVADIEKFGGTVTGSVSKKTSILLTNDKESGSTKNKKAQELEIPIMSERDFVSKYLK